MRALKHKALLIGVMVFSQLAVPALAWGAPRGGQSGEAVNNLLDRSAKFLGFIVILGGVLAVAGLIFTAIRVIASAFTNSAGATQKAKQGVLAVAVGLTVMLCAFFARTLVSELVKGGTADNSTNSIQNQVDKFNEIKAPPGTK